MAAALEGANDFEYSIKVVQLQRNFGQTAAMQAGIDTAAGEIIVTLDGDLQNDPADIPRMIAHLQEHDLDLLVGWRARRKDKLILRKIPSWIANRLIGKITGVRLHDYGCSLKVYRTTVIKQVRLLGEMHRFIPAWVAAVVPSSRIGEIEVSHHARVHGQSKYGISRSIRVILDLLSVLFFMRYRARPGHFFGTIGLTAWLYVIAPKDFLPAEDTGRLSVTTEGAQDASYENGGTHNPRFSGLASQKWFDDRLGANPPSSPTPVASLLEVARLRARARRAGLTDITLQGKYIRFAPVDLPDSGKVRLDRLYPRSILKPSVRTMLVPRPQPTTVGGPPIRDEELLAWARQVVDSVVDREPQPVS